MAAERAARRARRKAQRQQRSPPSRQALALSRYVLVLTNLEPELWSGLQVLELYRCRWQVELAFKRLNGLLKLGYLPKNDPQSARAWLQLKLLLALVIEKLCYDARFFSPWGYRLEFQPLGGVAGNDRRGADEPALPAVAT